MEKKAPKFSMEVWPSSQIRWMHGSILAISLFLVFLIGGSCIYAYGGWLGLLRPFFEFISLHSVWTVCILLQVLIMMDVVLGFLSIKVSLRKREDKKAFVTGFLVGVFGIVTGLATCGFLLFLVTYSS